MVIVCQTCGDRGFSVALIYCDKCQAHAVHRYCLYNLPKTFEEYVFWFCVDCEPRVVESVRTARGKYDIKLKKLKKMKKKKMKKKSEYDSGLLALVEMQRQTIPMLPPVENPKKDETLSESFKVGGPRSSEEATLIEAETSLLNSCSHSRGSDLIKIDVGVECVNNNMSMVAIDEHLNIIDHVQDPGSRELDGKYSGEVDKYVQAMATSNQIPLNIYVPAQPILESIWRGSFHLSGENLTIGIVAHLSSLACSKVCDTAKCLPQLLQLELLPRCDVWPKGFKQGGPSDESIALYFFPINERDLEIFDGLMDKMIYQDLGIKVVIQDVELLVYSSNVLPLHFQRFQEKFYLWGVFREKQPPHLTNGVRGEEKSSAKALTRDSWSPVSPLSDNEDYNATCSAKRAKGFDDSKRFVPTRHQKSETCEHCHGYHAGKCWKITGACLKCGSKDHFVRDCPKLVSGAPETCEHCHGNHAGKCWKITGACLKCGLKDHFIRDCSKMVSGAPTFAQQSTPIASRGRGSGQGNTFGNNIPTCEQCHVKHWGKCWKMTGACLKCGSKDHFIRDCPKIVSVAPTSTYQISTPTTFRGRGSG